MDIIMDLGKILMFSEGMVLVNYHYDQPPFQL